MISQLATLHAADQVKLTSLLYKKIKISSFDKSDDWLISIQSGIHDNKLVTCYKIIKQEKILGQLYTSSTTTTHALIKDILAYN